MKRFLKPFSRGQRGFTLIELLIVIAILGVLAALVVPNVIRFMKSGQLASAKQEFGTVQTSVDAVMAEAGWNDIDGDDWIGPGNPADETWEISNDDVASGPTTYDVAPFLRRDLQGDFRPGTDGLIEQASWHSGSSRFALGGLCQGKRRLRENSAAHLKE